MTDAIYNTGCTRTADRVLGSVSGHKMRVIRRATGLRAGRELRAP